MWTYATGQEGEEDGKPCVTIILFEKRLPQTSSIFLYTDLFEKDLKHWNLVKITTTHTSNSPVTFVTHTHFAVLLFLPSCCVNSLLSQSGLSVTWLVQCNPEESFKKAIPMLKLCKNSYGFVQKVLQSVAEFVPTRVNEILVLISLESRCFARFRPG